MSYVDLVLVTTEEPGTPILCYAPKFSSLKRGETVVLEGDVIAKVIDSYTADPTRDSFMFIRRLYGMREPHKIIARISRREMKYEEEDDVFNQTGE